MIGFARLHSLTGPAHYRRAAGCVELARTWREGDILDVDLPMHVHLAGWSGAVLTRWRST